VFAYKVVKELKQNPKKKKKKGNGVIVIRACANYKVVVVPSRQQQQLDEKVTHTIIRPAFFVFFSLGVVY
jgi:hypothetical protein